MEPLDVYEQPVVFFPKTEPECYDYAVVACMADGKWVFVRHRDRDTLELPGGHVEPGEAPTLAARRELYEESGALEFDLWPVCGYAVARGAQVTHGLLCFAHVRRFNDLPGEFEMAERVPLPGLPEKMTYPHIQPKLIERAQRWLDENAVRVYFIRHAESDHSVREDCARPLTEAGLRAAEALPDTLRGVRFDAIFSSPYLRAMQTVRPLAEAQGLEIIRDERLRERKVGEWVQDFKAFARRQWADFDYKLQRGESLREVQARNIEALREILASARGKTVAVGTHGEALSTILNDCDNRFGFDDYWRIVPVLPYVIRLTFLGDKCIETCEMTKI